MTQLPGFVHEVMRVPNAARQAIGPRYHEPGPGPEEVEQDLQFGPAVASHAACVVGLDRICRVAEHDETGKSQEIRMFCPPQSRRRCRLFEHPARIYDMINKNIRCNVVEGQTSVLGDCTEGNPAWSKACRREAV